MTNPGWGGAPGDQPTRHDCAADERQWNLVGNFARRAKRPDDRMMAMLGSRGCSLHIHAFQAFGVGGGVVLWIIVL